LAAAVRQTLRQILRPPNNNTATTTGDNSQAFAGGFDELGTPSNGNTATVTGDGLTATATDGETVVVPAP
jgi:hypothetical protein